MTVIPARTPAGSSAPAIRGSLLLTLALLATVAPLATDLYLSAFPDMTRDLGTDETGVQLTLTAFLVGLGLGQLVFGPLSDRYGRVRPLVAGAALCVVASAVAVVAPTADLLVAARVGQGLGGAAGVVIGRAVVSDLAKGPAAARALSLMMVIGSVAPVVAPLAGSLLVGSIGWRGVLGVVLALAVAMLAAVLVVVRETHPPARRGDRSDTGTGTGSAVRALRSRRYVGATLTFGFGFAVMMAYISASPFLYQDLMGVSQVEYGLLFGVNALLLGVVGGVSGRLASRFPVRRLLGTGVTAVVLACTALMVLVLTGVPSGWLAVPIAVAVGSVGLVLGNSAALALAAVPGASGTASALLGALQFGLAAAVSPLVSLGGGTRPLALATVMLGASVLALGGFLLARPRPEPAGAVAARAGVPASVGPWSSGS